MKQLTNRRNFLVTVSLLLTVTTLSFFSMYGQNGASALSISQTEGKVIAADFDGIDGESEYLETERWIDVLSYSWGVEKPGGGATGQSRRRGSAVVDQFVLVKNYDKSSPKLLEKSLMGEVIPLVTIAEYINGLKYWEYELKNVMVTSYFVGGSRDFEGPDLEQVSLNFEEIKVTYTEYDENGSSKGNTETTWKVEEGTK